MKNQEQNFRKVTGEIRGMIDTLTDYLERFSAMPFIYDVEEKDSLETIEFVKKLSTRIEDDLAGITFCLFSKYDEDAMRTHGHNVVSVPVKGGTSQTTESEGGAKQ